MDWDSTDDYCDYDSVDDYCDHDSFYDYSDSDSMYDQSDSYDSTYDDDTTDSGELRDDWEWEYGGDVYDSSEHDSHEMSDNHSGDDFTRSLKRAAFAAALTMPIGQSGPHHIAANSSTDQKNTPNREKTKSGNGASSIIGNESGKATLGQTSNGDKLFICKSLDFQILMLVGLSLWLAGGLWLVKVLDFYGFSFFGLEYVIVFVGVGIPVYAFIMIIREVIEATWHRMKEKMPEKNSAEGEQKTQT